MLPNCSPSSAQSSEKVDDDINSSIACLFHKAEDSITWVLRVNVVQWILTSKGKYLFSHPGVYYLGIREKLASTCENKAGSDEK